MTSELRFLYNDNVVVEVVTVTGDMNTFTGRHLLQDTAPPAADPVRIYSRTHCTMLHVFWAACRDNLSHTQEIELIFICSKKILCEKRHMVLFFVWDGLSQQSCRILYPSHMKNNPICIYRVGPSSTCHIHISFPNPQCCKTTNFR